LLLRTRQAAPEQLALDLQDQYPDDDYETRLGHIRSGLTELAHNGIVHQHDDD